MIGRDLILVSDLHMGEGRDPASGRIDRHECFFADDAFADFVDHLVDRGAAEERSWHMVILGDFVDFLLTSRREAPGPRSLARIGRGHPKVFEALARFRGHGYDITWIAGNHDPELTQPAMLSVLSDLVPPSGATPGRLDVRPWFVHVPGLLYAEHGNHYHDINAFPDPIHPLGRPGGPATAPLGSALTTYLVRATPLLDPIGSGTLSPAGLLRRSVAQPRLAATTWRLHAGFLRAAGLYSVRLAAGRATTTPRPSVPAADADGSLDDPALAALRRLSPLRPLAIERRAARLALGAVRGKLTRRNAASSPSPSYHHLAALRVAAVLEEHGHGVPFHVMGHSHRPERAEFTSPAGRACTYLNTGTWSVRVPPDVGEPPLTYVEIGFAADGTSTATLRRWDPTHRRAIDWSHG